jgi:signal transduction histidine kinase
MKLPRRSIVVYSVAFLGIGAATAIRFALDPVLGEHLMFSMYYLAVSLAAWAGGIRPAMVTAILSSVLANYIFSDPRGRLWITNWEELVGLIIFLSVSLFIGVLCEISLKSIGRARAAEQQKDDFLAILAHELRNPLAVIHYTNVAEQNSKPGSQERSEVINRQVQQLDQMIEDLTDIARVSRGKFRLEFEPISVASIVDEALAQVRHFIEERDHELNIERSPEQLILWGDSLRLQQVLTNLLRNAARYTPRGGKIQFRTYAEKNCAVFRIRDNGQGIPKEMLSRVFDLHTQVERSLERSGSGLGVGLALVRTLVELHGGTIAAISDGPDRGSEFIVRLPLYRERADARPGTVRQAS